MHTEDACTRCAGSPQERSQTLKVRIDISVGILDRIPDARLRGEMNHHRKAMRPEQIRDAAALDKIELHETESGIVFQNVETRFLQRRIVIAVEIVQPDDAMAGLQQFLRDVKPDEACRPRHKYCLIRH